MNYSKRKRLSTSPEKMILSKVTYSLESDCARTFFIIGDAVVWSHHPHIQIISCFRTMKNAQDLKTLRIYGVEIFGNLSQEAFDRFRYRLTGVLGDNRRRNKAGRVWLEAIDEDGTEITVISFWAKKTSIRTEDIVLLRRAFKINWVIWVDYEDRAQSTLFTTSRG